MKRYEIDTHIRRLDSDSISAEPAAAAPPQGNPLVARSLDALTNTFLGFLLLFSIHLPIHALLHTGVHAAQLLLVATLAWTLAALLLGTKIGRMALAGVALIALARIGYLLLVDLSFREDFRWALVQMEEVFVRLYWYEPIVGTPLGVWLLPMDATAAALESVFVFLLTFRRIRFWPLAASGIAAYLTGFAVSGLVNRTGFLLFMGLLALGYIRFVAERRRKAGIVHDQPPMGRMMLQALPLILIPVLFVAVIPKKDVPLQWPWLDQKVAEWTTAINERFVLTDTEFFNLGAAGFSGKSQRLGGRIHPGSALVMTVTSENRAYLRGAAYSAWQGDSWSQSRVVDQYFPVAPERAVSPVATASRLDADAAAEGLFLDDADVLSLDLTETRTGWADIPVGELFPDVSEQERKLLDSLSDGSLERLLFPVYDMDIQYRNLSTRSVFMPLKTVLPVRLPSNGSLNLLQNGHGVGVTEAKLPFGTQYALTFVQPMYGDPMLRQALRLSKENLYQNALFRYLATHRGGAGEAAPDGRVIMRLQRLVDTSARIRAEYTLLPDTVPVRIHDLAASITDGLDNAFDKAAAVETWLRGSFPYTLDTQRLPDGADFVDHFLFTEQQGYCTYFASAMTVMLREIGIPARYVEGYVLPDNGEDNKEYRVTNQSAHAWPEVYFEGFGWMQFEPTPGFASVTQYLIEQDTAGAYAGTMLPDDLQAMIDQYRFGQDIGGGPPVVPQRPERMAVSRALFPLLAVAVAALLYPMGMVLSRLRRVLIRRSSAKLRIQKNFAVILRWLSLTGLKLRPGETVMEFARRAADSYYLNSMPITQMTALYMRVLYGDKVPDLPELLLFETAMEELRDQVLRDLGIRRWIPLRFVLLGI